MKNLQIDRQNLKKFYDKLMDKYEIALVRDFECDYNKCEEIDSFFLNTYEDVISKLCYKYQELFNKKIIKDDFSNTTICVPIITVEKFSKSEKQYLLSLYIKKLVELDIDSFGLTSINVVKKWVSKDNIPEEINIYNNPNIFASKNTYSLETEFSLIKSYALNERKSILKKSKTK